MYWIDSSRSSSGGWLPAAITASYSFTLSSNRRIESIRRSRL
jgi:hypothetical protein